MASFMAARRDGVSGREGVACRRRWQMVGLLIYCFTSSVQVLAVRHTDPFAVMHARFEIVESKRA